MQQYPYEATLVQKEVIKPKPVARELKYGFLDELKERLQPNQAIQIVVPAKERATITVSWRRIGKGQEPHSLSKRRDDGSYIVYLWVGELV